MLLNLSPAQTSTVLYTPELMNEVATCRLYIKPLHVAIISNAAAFFKPSLLCTTAAVDGQLKSGVMVPTTMQSISSKEIVLDASELKQSFAAATIMSEVPPS